MLGVILSLTRPETGWPWQHPELAHNVKPVPGLISAEEIAAAQKDWHAACEICFRHAAHRSKEIQRVIRVHRDPFELIMCVLEADSPLAEYCKITEEIIKRMPDGRRYPRATAETVRSFLMLRLCLHLGLRQKNLRQLLVCPRGHFPTSERRLEQMKRGELRWSERDRGAELACRRHRGDGQSRQPSRQGRAPRHPRGRREAVLPAQILPRHEPDRAVLLKAQALAAKGGQADQRRYLQCPRLHSRHSIR